MDFSASLKANVRWPELSPDGKVLTKQFLDAGDTIVAFFDCLGILYTPLKRDMEGNIAKLKNQYARKPTKYNYIHDMILEEKESDEDFATDALLWLKRGLHFIYLFFERLINDYDNKVTNDSLLQNCHYAYETSLKPYHNVVLRSFYKILSTACPKRSALLQSMSNFTEIKGKDNDYDEFMKMLKVYEDGLRINLQAILDLYETIDLDTSQKL